MSKKRPTQEQRIRLSIPISWKLLGTTMLVGAVAVVIALSGLHQMNTLNQRLNRIVDVAAERVKLASMMRQYLITVTRAEKNMILAQSEDELEGYARTIEEVLVRMQQQESRLRLLVDAEGRLQLENYSAKWQQWQDNHDEVRYYSGVTSTIRARELSLQDAEQAFNRFDTLVQSVADQPQIDNSSDTVAGNDSLPRSPEVPLLIASIRHSGSQMRLAEKNVLLSTTPETMKIYEDKFEPLINKLDSDLQRLSNLSDPTEDDLLDDATEAWKQYKALSEEIRRLAHEKASGWAVVLAYDIGVPLADECERLVDAIVRKNEEKMSELQRDSADLFAGLRNTLIGVSAVGIVLSVAVSYFTGQRIARSLSSLAVYAQNIRRAKDLSKPVPRVTGDEVGKLAEALDGMRETIYQQTRELAKLNQTLKHKNEEMEQFVYTVSHDLKSPLVSCKGLLGLLREDIADGNQREVDNSMHRLGQATDQLSQIIDDLLALSRIGRKPLSLSAIDTAAVLGTLREQLSERIDKLGAKIRVSSSLPDIVGDESDITRVFENLLTNALKYAGDEPLIEIGGEQHDADVRLYVRDNGPGIEPQYHKKVFGLFQRLDSSKPGTGLGLASVSKIMRMHGGKVWVESQPEDGATFWLSFPRRKPSN